MTDDRPGFLKEAERLEQDDERLDNWFTYHPPSEDQIPRYAALRNAARAFSTVILDNVPICADQTAALRKVREAVMTANAAIACGGK